MFPSAVSIAPPSPDSRRELFLAALTGLLLALSFPLPGLYFLAWVALVPLLEGCRGATPHTAARMGFVSGVVAYAGITYWVNIVMTTYGGLPLPVSLILNLLLVAYLALYPALFAWLLAKAEQGRIPLLLAAPVAWTALEYFRSHLLTGFPWALLGHSQYRMLTLIQVADLTGVYGVSFLLVSVNVVLWLCMRSVVAGDGYPRRQLLILFMLLSAVGGYGAYRLIQQPAGTPLRVGLLQGNIPQNVKWDPSFQESTLAVYERLSRESAAGGARLLVWPESAAPFYLQDDLPRTERLQSLARDLRASMVVGSPAYEVDAGRVSYLNSAYLIAEDGTFAGRSDKLHLVPFGEYVPLGRFFPFISKMVTGIGDFSPGKGAFPLASSGPPMGVLVCFEGIFPEISRDYVRNGARLLVSITNDAWFGRSSAPYQHLAMTVFRAVENRVPLIRSANTGVSAMVDSRGHILGTTPLFTTCHLEGDIQVTEEQSFYTRYGDLFAVSCVVLLLMGTLYVWRAQWREGKEEPCSEKNLHDSKH